MPNKKSAIMYIIFYLMVILGVALLLINVFVKLEMLQAFAVPLLLLTFLLIAVGAIGLFVTYYKMEYDLGEWGIDFESFFIIFKIFAFFFLTVGIYGLVVAIRILANKI